MLHKYTLCVNVRLFGFKGPHQEEILNFWMMQACLGSALHLSQVNISPKNILLYFSVFNKCGCFKTNSPISVEDIPLRMLSLSIFLVS